MTGDVPDDLDRGDSFLLAEGEESRVIITERQQRFTPRQIEETILIVEPWTKREE